MREEPHRPARTSHGFTLIELLIVVIVLGILAAIVVFAVSNSRKNAVAAVCKADVGAIQTSAAAVSAHTGADPTVDTSKSDPQQRFASLLTSANAGGILKSYPSNPNYVLEYVGTTSEVNVFPAGTVYTTSGPMTSGALGTGAAACELLD